MDAPKVGNMEPAKLIQPVAIFGSHGDGPGMLNEPRDIAIDKDGNIYVADFRNYRVQVLNSAGKFVRMWGSKGAKEGEFNDLCGIAVTPDGHVIVCDTWNHRTQVFDNQGNFLKLWGDMVAPRGALATPDNHIYVADSGKNFIKFYDSVNRNSPNFFWGEAGHKPGQFVEPVGIAMDQTGNIWVADNDNARVQIFDKKGSFLNELPVRGWTKTGCREPYIDVLPDGTFVATVPSFNRVNRYSKVGQLLLSFGGKGGAPGQLSMPTGIAVDKQGYVYVSDTWNHRIQKFKLP